MTDTLALTLRVGLSLAFVLVLMWFAARLLRGKMVARGAGVLEVLARQQVGRGATVAVVRVADRALILGVTEHGVNILGDPIDDLSALTEASAPAEPLASSLVPAGRTGTVDTTRGTNGNSALAGSILSPAMWRQALHVLRERTVRR